MKASQIQVLVLIAAQPEKWFRPHELSQRIQGTSGGTARLLRSLCKFGMAEQQQYGWYNRIRRIPVLEYRVTAAGRDAARPLLEVAR